MVWVAPHGATAARHSPTRERFQGESKGYQSILSSLGDAGGKVVAAHKRGSLPGTGGRLEHTPALRKHCGSSAGKDVCVAVPGCPLHSLLKKRAEVRRSPGPGCNTPKQHLWLTAPRVLIHKLATAILSSVPRLSPAPNPLVFICKPGIYCPFTGCPASISLHLLEFIPSSCSVCLCFFSPSLPSSSEASPLPAVAGGWRAAA